MKIAIVHEMLIKLGGAEKVVENWLENYPEADIFTLIYDEKKVGCVFPKTYIHPQVFSLFTQKIYTLFKKQRLCLPFMAQSIEKLDLSDYDIVLISSSGFAHGVITKPETKTIVYYHAPARYMWDRTNEYKKDIGAQRGIKGLLINSLFLKLRQWDIIASNRNDILLANSTTTQGRIWKYYRKKSEVLYPPIETERFAKNIESQEKQEILYQIIERLTESQSVIGGVSRDSLKKKFGVKSFQNIISSKNYYIILSALTEFKRLDIAIKNFQNISETNLVIIGKGEQKESLEKLANNARNIFFVGAQFGDDLVVLVQNSLGLIFPGEEDFGIVPIEIMAAGKPVFALKKGGLTETVLEGKTGEFFTNSEGKDFKENFLKFHNNNLKGKYKEQDCKNRASEYDKKLFEEKISKYINK